ncbi:hypothetical protein GQX73_g8524 [Xylaria multiplex]|uniref:C2H2-type domain-containing protein n=1 Tax=Xylaria multiplex TaxID=323545 RepID=A0A7C8IPB9_9PEZI|nr:hypothetical protein GQX73_g8524 [Xylaria multiplex]
MNASLQTDNADADTPGHKLPNASDPPIMLPHARQVVSSEGPVAQRDDQDVCVCIICHTRCPNNAALRKHGEKEDHRSYGCVCGETFKRPDALGRHIASKNNVNKFPCPLCEQVPRAFSRADHRLQHLRTFHKIPAGRIPEDFGSNFLHSRPATESIVSRQSTPQYPCLIPGCMMTGESAYLHQIDFDEHMALMHSAPQNDMLALQGVVNPAPAWTNDGSQQNTYLQPANMIEQYAQQAEFWQPNPTGNLWGFLENNAPTINLTPQPDEQFNMDFE